MFRLCVFLALWLFASTAYPCLPGLKPPVSKLKGDALMLERAKRWLPLIDLKIQQYWPEMPPPRHVLLASIQKESLWNPCATLRTSRELGRGFGQLTITSKMNIFEEVKRLSPALRDWDYESDPFNPAKQIIAMLAKNKFNYLRCDPISEGWQDKWGCTMSAYNGGLGGYLADRRVCGNTQGCNPRLWFDNVELTSLKEKVARPGYGEPFYQINRRYVRETVGPNKDKYNLML